MVNKVIRKQINELLESLNFAPVASLVKSHRIYDYVVTEKELRDDFYLTDKSISNMNRIRADEYFGFETDEYYLYLLQEAIFLRIVALNSKGRKEAMEMYNRGITITI